MFRLDNFTASMTRYHILDQWTDPSRGRLSASESLRDLNGNKAIGAQKLTQQNRNC